MPSSTWAVTDFNVTPEDTDTFTGWNSAMGDIVLVDGRLDHYRLSYDGEGGGQAYDIDCGKTIASDGGQDPTIVCYTKEPPTSGWSTYFFRPTLVESETAMKAHLKTRDTYWHGQ